MLIFDLGTDAALGQSLAEALDEPLSALETRFFEDGECKRRPLVDPRGEDVYVLHSLYGDTGQSPHDKLFALLTFVATLCDHGAARVTAVIPYMAYGRKDRRTKPLDPIGQRYVAQLLEACGAAQIIALEVHNPAAFGNAFRCPAIHLDAYPAFDPVARLAFESGRVVVASPDPGGVKRAQLWREHLQAGGSREVGFAMLDKRRSEGTTSGLDAVVGEVEGATVLLIDDLISTGQTLLRAASALRRAGATSVCAFAAHGLFVQAADWKLCGHALDKVIVCDSVPPFRVASDSPLSAKLQIVSCVPLLARAIRDSHAAWPR